MSVPGSLRGPGDYDQQPNGTYYQSLKAGVPEGHLVGPANADFDLYVYQYVNNTWTLRAKSENDGSSETIQYSGAAGYDTWTVESYSGSGSCSFYLKKP